MAQSCDLQRCIKNRIVAWLLHVVDLGDVHDGYDVIRKSKVNGYNCIHLPIEDGNWGKDIWITYKDENTIEFQLYQCYAIHRRSIGSPYIMTAAEIEPLVHIFHKHVKQASEDIEHMRTLDELSQCLSEVKKHM